MNSFDKIQSIISETLNVSRDKITPSLAIGQIPEWDSMGNMAIISAIEENLRIEFPIEILFELNSVKALVEEVDKLI